MSASHINSDPWYDNGILSRFLVVLLKLSKIYSNKSIDFHSLVFMEVNFEPNKIFYLAHLFSIFEPNKSPNRLMSFYNWQQKDWPQFRFSLKNVEDTLLLFSEKV